MKIYVVRRMVFFILFSLITFNIFSQTFVEQTGIILPAISEYGTVAWGDYDNDGYLDILIAGSGSTVVYKNNSGVSFAEQTSIILSGVSRCSAAWGDYNNDGYLDILLTGQEKTTGNQISKIYKNNGNGTFSEQTNILLPGVNFSSVSWGDINNDGYLDILLTGNSVSGPISKIFNNNGDGTFTEQSGTSLTAVNYGSSSLGDFNNDGLLDILLTGRTGLSNTGNIVSKVFKNNGDGTFSEQKSIVLVPVYDGSVAWGDYDNDGFLDILLSGSTVSNNVAKIYKNDGKGNFNEQTSISLPGVLQSSVAWGDYDNDGLLDILLTGETERSGNISKVFHNNGNNTFSDQSDIILAGISWGSAIWGDYNKDGKLDILLSGHQISTRVTKLYKNNTGIINISPAAPIGLTGSLDGTNLSFSWRPIKTDNTPFKGLTYNVRFGRNSLGGDIISPMSSSVGLRRIVAMGNAGHDTLIQIKNVFPGQYYWSAQAIDNGFLGGLFSVQQSLRVDSVQSSVLSAKVLDNRSLKVRWKRGNGQRCIVFCRIGSGTGSLPAHFKSYVADNTFASGDQIGKTGWFCVYNGKSDSLTIKGLWPENSYSIHVIEYIGISGSERYFRELRADNIGSFSTGIFTEQNNVLLPGVELGSSVMADFNNDGYLDVLVSGNSLDAGSHLTKIYLNNGNGSFTPLPDNTLPGLFRGSGICGDYNNDGYLDVLLAGYLNYGGTGQLATRIFKNNGNNTFTEQTGISFIGLSDASAAWGDYDNDGYLDLLLTGYDDAGGIRTSKIYHNNRNNSFTELTGVSLTGVYYGSCAWGDYNNDGYPDIFLSGSATSGPVLKIYRNNGNSSFTEITNNSFSPVSGELALADYDNDGYPDFAIAGTNGSNNPVSFIYHNNGNGSFTQDNGILLNETYGAVSWGDYNNDGYLDLLFSGGYTGYVSKLYKNNGPPDYTFIEQTGTFSIGASGGSASWGDYNNDGYLDILITGRNGSSTYSKIFRNNTSIKIGSFLPNRKPPAIESIYSTLLPNVVKLQWTPITSDETPSKAMSYNIRYKKLGAINWLASPHSVNNGTRLVPALGNLFLNSSFNLKNLPEGKYLWQLQAVDQGYQGGTWSAENSFEVKNVQSFFSADTVCLGQPTHFLDQSVSTDGIAKWMWDFKDGSNSSLQNPSHIFLASGVHNIKLVITSNGGVKDSLEKNIIVKPKPITDFSSSMACQGTETVLVNLTNPSGFNILSWSWDYGDGKGSTFQNPGSHGYLTAGDYQLTLTATADNGCSGNVIKTVTVAAFPVAVITANAPLSFCDRDSVTLSVISNPQYSYKWMLNNTAITNAITNNYTAKLSGNFSVEITNTKGLCKTNSSQVIVTKLSMPATPAIVTENYQEGKCPGENQIILSVDQTVPEYSYQWKRNGTPISNAVESNYSGILTAGDYTVEVSQSGCKTVSAVKPIIYFDAPAKPTIFIHGPKVWYLACSNDKAKDYKWYYDGNLITGADKYIYVPNQKLGNYYVTISNEAGCYTSSDIVTIPIETLSVDETDPFARLIIYPNPNSGQFTLKTQNKIFGEVTISVLNQRGNEIFRGKFEKTSEQFSSQINLKTQSKGIYIVNLSINGRTSERKIIIE